MGWSCFSSRPQTASSLFSKSLRKQFDHVVMSSDESSNAPDVKPTKKAAAKKNAGAKELKAKGKKRAPVESESDDVDDIAHESSGSDGDGQMASKKKQKSGVPKQQEKSSSAPKKSKQYVKSAEGEDMVEFGPKRFASVTEFKGSKMVNIREYYEKNGQLLPGKKGISMKLDQWKQFKSIIPDVDELIKKMMTEEPNSYRPEKISS
uniref:Transcriptional coactivator p15 (PC4) C-terminal domain-containing protein n=1 Tax=Ditylenchus dipsaci TaxID=166011 RepID=A0A915EKW9_9BILA